MLVETKLLRIKVKKNEKKRIIPCPKEKKVRYTPPLKIFVAHFLKVSMVHPYEFIGLLL